MLTFLILLIHINIFIAVRIFQTKNPFRIKWEKTHIPILQKQKRLKYVGMLDMTLNIYVCVNRVFLGYDAIFLSAWVIHCLWWEWHASGNYKKASLVAAITTGLRSLWFSFSLEYRYLGNICMSLYMLYCSVYSNYSLPI